MKTKQHPERIQRYARAALVITSALCASANIAHADEAIDVSVEYTADYIAPLAGATHGEGHFLDNLDVGATFDMARIAGWGNTTFFVHLLNNSGEAPNDVVGTAQGVDNIEVTRQRARLYEIWIDTQLAGASVRAGLYDLNSEFYANEAAGLLIAPAFGIGSELAATGANGPSIFPSTALAVRIAAPVSEHSTFRFAVLNADAGVLGDPDGVDTSFDNGVLLVGEWAWAGETAVSVGGWTYSEDQDDIRDVDGFGAPTQRRAAGAYLTAERTLWNADDVRATTAFVRVGISDGDTTPYSGGWQAGVLVERVFASRPDSQLSLGAYQGRFDDKQRANERDAGVAASEAETGFEFTYSDQINPWLRLQPDVQLVLDPAGDRDRADLWIAGLRIAITPFAH